MVRTSRKSKLPAPDWGCRMLSKISPRLAVNRYKNQCAFQAMSAYTGADKKRRSMSSWHPSDGDFATDVLPELPTLREKSEHLYRNNMIAASAVNTETNSVVGPGLTAMPRIDAEYLGLNEEQANEWEAQAQRRWLLFSESKFCTVNRRHNFRELQNLALLSSLVRGDSFILTPVAKPTDFFKFRLRLQAVEADRVCNENDRADTENLCGGIETNKDGSLKQVHIRQTHPGSTIANRAKWDKVPFFGKKTGRRNVLQIYKPIRVDQSRGVPMLAPVIEGLKQFGELTQATVDAAVIQTFLSVFIETPEGEGLNLPAGETVTSTSEAVKLESAAIIDLAEGEKPHIVNPTHPNANYNAFAGEFYAQIGAALSIPKEVLIKYFQSSYTAAQGSLLEAWRYFMNRRTVMVDNLCDPVYELFIAEEVANGMLPAPGFFLDPAIRAAYCGVHWGGPPRGHIREDVQNKADGYAEDRGWKTGQQNTQERGGRWERNHRQRVKEVQRRQKDGLITTEGTDLPDVSTED